MEIEARGSAEERTLALIGKKVLREEAKLIREELKEMEKKNEILPSLMDI